MEGFPSSSSVRSTWPRRVPRHSGRAIADERGDEERYGYRLPGGEAALGEAESR